MLLLTDRVDEWLVAHLFEFEGKPLASVAKGEVDLSAVKSETETPQETAAKPEEHKALVERLRNLLGERVKDVRVSHRLVDSPACLVAGEHDMSPHLIRMLQSLGQKTPEFKPILEVNPSHPLLRRLAQETDARQGDLAHLLLDQALLLEGGQLPDPAAFVRRLNGLLTAAA